MSKGHGVGGGGRPGGGSAGRRATSAHPHTDTHTQRGPEQRREDSPGPEGPVLSTVAVQMQ